MPFYIVKADITSMNVEAVVNAANSSLKRGGGVCGAIFAAAGDELVRSCTRIGHCDTGHAVLTDGFHLKAKYVIHAVGPIWRGGGEGEELLLSNCYQNVLAIARINEIHSIAFPLLSSGIYGYPKRKAIQVAAEAITGVIKGENAEVYLAIFDEPTFEMCLSDYPQYCVQCQ